MASAKKARKPEDKEARRQLLLLVASSMFDEIPYAKITMADVAERAGLAKGTVYLYFDSKEELFLGVLQELLFEWFGVMDAALDRLRTDLDANGLFELLTSSNERRETTTRLMAIVGGVLEQNVSFQAASRYKRRLWMHMTKTGAKLEAKWPLLEVGGGFRLLGQISAIIIGARHLCDVAPVIVNVVDAFDLAGFRPDFEVVAGSMLVNHLSGLESRARSRAEGATLAARKRRRPA